MADAPKIFSNTKAYGLVIVNIWYWSFAEIFLENLRHLNR